MLWVTLLLSLYGTVCMGQPSVVGGGALWSGGLTVPYTGAQSARDFPQGTPVAVGLSLGLAAGSTTQGLGTQFMSVGAHHRFRVFHAALLGSASGDKLSAEYSVGLRGGLSTPKWGLGLGWDGRLRKIEDRMRTWPVLIAGISLFWNPRTTLHIRSSFMARQHIDDPLIVDGFSSAWLIDHKIGKTRLMVFMQQWETRGWDTGLGCALNFSPNWEATACGSAQNRSFSFGLRGAVKNWLISASCMISPLPTPGTLTTLQFEPGIRSP